ncbi:hypothetical protein EI94DRAFT_1018006 [Lactarius quietus]|nr:hypothetical protein EI94DRAFT_1018006 [Lactarius quietus]
MSQANVTQKFPNVLSCVRVSPHFDDILLRQAEAGDPLESYMSARTLLGMWQGSRPRNYIIYDPDSQIPDLSTGSPSHPQQPFKIFIHTMQFKTVPRLPAPYHAPTFQKRAQGTLSTVCVRRMQTVYHKHTPETDGMILAVKFENVPANAVRTQKRSATLRAGASCVVVGLKAQQLLVFKSRNTHLTLTPFL